MEIFSFVWYKHSFYSFLDQHEGIDIFYHNCSAGFDTTDGSLAMNDSYEVIGINIEHSIGWTVALRLSTIKDEIIKIFPDIKDKVYTLNALL